MSTFISMEQFNVKWKIRQENIFHNSMLGCCSHCHHIHTVLMIEIAENYILFALFRTHLLSCKKKRHKIKSQRDGGRRKLIDLIKLWMRPWLKLLCYLFCFCFGRYPLIDDDESCLLLLAYTDWCGNWFCFNNKSFTLSFLAISFNNVHRHVVIHSTKKK